MACFIVPAAEAVVTTIIGKAVKSKEKEIALQREECGEVMESKLPMSKKISWLNTMLWGGSALLAFEHLWHGEITPFFPFLTAMGNKGDAIRMLHEMSTVGVSMSVLVTAVWAVMCLVVKSFEKPVKEETMLTKKNK